MKTTLAFFTILLFIQCNTSTEPIEQNVIIDSNPLHQTWCLTKKQGDFQPQYLFITDAVKWTFTNQNTIIVSIMPGTLLNASIPLPQNGTYTYELLADNKIKIANRTYVLVQTLSKLVLDAGLTSDSKKLYFDLTD